MSQATVTPAGNSSLLRHAQRYTRRLALRHYENFVVGGLLTPRRMRQDFYNLYAYCRAADDLADELDDPAESLRRLDQWQRWLNDCYAGRPVDHPIFTALQQTIRQHQIPQQPFAQLLVAFRQDQTINHYDSFTQLREYCRSSADPVGHLVLHLAGVYDTKRAELADNICTGLQLANFCQDVRRDALQGRVYIPQDELAAHQVDPQLLSATTPPPGGIQCLAAQIERAETFLRGGLPLANHVPRWLKRDIKLFAAGGLAILQEIRHANYDVWTRRPRVGRPHQLRLMMQIWMGR